MANQEINFVDGITFYPPRDGAPDFVIGNLSIHSERLSVWIENQQPDDKGYIRVAIKRAKSGKVYCALDTWKPSSERRDNRTDDQASSRVRESFAKPDGQQGDEVPF